MPTLRSSGSRNGASIWRAVRSSRPINCGVLNTAGIPSVAKSMQCLVSTTKASSPAVPILGGDFIWFYASVVDQNPTNFMPYLSHSGIVTSETTAVLSTARMAVGGSPR